MMKPFKLTIRFIVAAALIVGMMIGQGVLSAEKPEEEKGKIVAKENFDPWRYACLNINNTWMWAREDGHTNHSPQGQDGGWYPRRTTHTIYQDGLVWGSKAYLDAAKTIPAPFGQIIRVGGVTYGTGCREGWVNGFGATAVPVAKDDPLARIYRIRRDWKDLWEKYQIGGEENKDAIAILTDDASVCWEIPMSDVTINEIQSIVDDFEWCWQNWPTQLGAPFVDRNGDGVYTPPPLDYALDDLIDLGYDEPGVAGADPNSPAHEVLFNIFNDLYRNMRFGSEPTGLELRQTIWGYARTDAMGNLYFKKLMFINKGGVEIDAVLNKGAFYLDSMYICQWSDPDLGQAGDDLLGCDTLLSLGYVYNGNAIDLLYRDFGLAPPSGGYDFLQGPAIATGNPADVAVFDLKYKPGFVNLGMSGFSYFSAGSPYSDPSNSTYDTGAIRWYKMHRGYAPLSGPDVRYNHPPGVPAGKYPLAGDPVAGTGHIDGMGTDYSFVPGDRRLLCITGPWAMAPGDTQEVVVATVFGLGSDRLSSVSVMKFNDRFAQATYDALFAVPNAPATPSVQVAELDRKVLLNWGNNATRVNLTENTVNNPGGFVFEGYNVYQLPSEGSTLGAATRIATFDLPTDPAIIKDEGYDAVSGQILELPVQFGSNSGIRREFVFDRNYIRDVDNINNGTEYFIVITAYSVATTPGYLPTSLESKYTVLTVQPQQRGMGEAYNSAYGDTLAVTHTAGAGDATIYPIIVDPDAIVAATYSVEWDAADSTYMINKAGAAVAKGFTTVFSGLSNYSMDENYPIVDGMKVKVGSVTFAAPNDFDHYTVTPAANAGKYNINSYMASGWASTARATDAFGDGTTDEDLLKSDLELRFTGVYGDKQGTVIPVASGGQMATVYSANTMGTHPLNPNPGSSARFVQRIPFEVWDIERNMQINMLMRDRIQQATADPFYAFNPADRVYAFLNALPYKETALTTADDASLTWNLVFWKTGWTTGDVLTFKYLNKVVPGQDVISWSTSGLQKTVNEDLKKKDLDRINVFPNPYYAFNPLEIHKLVRFVTFNNLPETATIRIFNLAGQYVRMIEHDGTQFERWDLTNHMNMPVASGMYIAHITIPGVGEKILKIAVIQEAEILDVY